MKYYEVEVVDTRSGRVLNRKTVVDVPEAALQTPDADGVAMAKVTGADPSGAPILQPLVRAEREFVMQRYVDKNVKARRLPAGSPGAINDLAEHGVTLVMDDAGAKAAGFLLPRFGVPFLPEAVGMRCLKRIAPFVLLKNAKPAEREKMYRQMVEVVRSGGGFGQHAVVVTSDSRYLGEVPSSPGDRRMQFPSQHSLPFATVEFTGSPSATSHAVGYDRRSDRRS